MSNEREAVRIVESWLEEGPTVLPDRVVDAVAADLPATRQRRAGWLARRFPIMNSTTFRFSVAAAAVVAIALLGINLLPGSGVGGPQPTPSASPTPAPTASPSPLPTPTPSPVGLHGSLAAGLQTVHLSDGLSMDMTLPDGWTGVDGWYVTRSSESGSTLYVAFWTMPDAANVYADPCRQTLPSPGVGGSVADLAAALAALPGVLATTPTAVDIGGFSGLYLELALDDIACSPGSYYLWTASGTTSEVRYAQATGEVDYLWILDANGQRILILGEEAPRSTPADAEEIRAIVESMQPTS